MTLNPLVWLLVGVAVISDVAAHMQLRSINKRIKKMNKAEQEQFDLANTKVDALVTAVQGLTAEIAEEKQALADALNAPNQDAAEVVAAATALNTKLDGALAAAQAALTPPAAPAADPTVEG